MSNTPRPDYFRCHRIKVLLLNKHSFEVPLVAPDSRLSRYSKRSNSIVSMAVKIFFAIFSVVLPVNVVSVLTFGFTSLLSPPIQR